MAPMIIAEQRIILFLVNFIAIVTKQRGLSAAYDDRETALINSMVAPLYLCRTKNYHFTQRINDKYLLFIDKDIKIGH